MTMFIFHKQLILSALLIIYVHTHSSRSLILTCLCLSDMSTPLSSNHLLKRARTRSASEAQKLKGKIVI